MDRQNVNKNVYVIMLLINTIVWYNRRERP